ncbi:MAG: prolipoprotein diacylglyceryl transferase [Marinovum algicola]|uniref:Phosphatidylglycerol--prolipoprotein diacylglyceryl transferase n=1 Tax=Marinovum algicola TaxID=42444 RepID=A0A975ZLA5_9RHOB|nr:prolipoprotein diacylglyceryl transferase [Marinovum algicola]SEI53964.1 Prolipoprotein diacylglyceryl transferase [Marinovum algicola]SLN29289.1 Prolipoprotein diacylglyceryl transferase [Marinovum algicola]
MSSVIPFPPLSPEIFSVDLFGMSFALRWYALAYIAGIVLGWVLAVRLLKRPTLWRNDSPPMTPAQLEDLMTWIILGIILGGRLGFVLFYQPGYYLANPGEILMIWQGGMSFHGGLLGVILAAWIWSARNNVERLPMADMMALGTWPGLLFGRLANFVNAELWGRPTDLPWAVAFPGTAAQNCGQPAGELCGRHPSQLYEAGLEGVLLGVLLLWLALARGWLKTPGRIAAMFFAGYGAARFFVEFFRQPDEQFVSPGNPLGLAWHVGGWGLTMGQLLSLPMIVVGLWLVLRKRPA